MKNATFTAATINPCHRATYHNCSFLFVVALLFCDLQSDNISGFCKLIFLFLILFVSFVKFVPREKNFSFIHNFCHIDNYILATNSFQW